MQKSKITIVQKEAPTMAQALVYNPLLTREQRMQPLEVPTQTPQMLIMMALNGKNKEEKAESVEKEINVPQMKTCTDSPTPPKHRQSQQKSTKGNKSQTRKLNAETPPEILTQKKKTVREMGRVPAFLRGKSNDDTEGNRSNDSIILELEKVISELSMM